MFKAKISVVALLVLAVSATLLTGCGRKGLVSINGAKVSKDEFYARLEKVPVQTTSGTKPAGQYVIEQIIGEQLIQQYAKDQGVAPSETQIKKKLDFIKKESGSDLNKLLAQQGTTMEMLKTKITLEQSFINIASKGITISDAKVKDTYNKLLATKNSPFKTPDQVKISVIVTKSKPNVDKAYQMLGSGLEFATVAMDKNDDPNIKQRRGMIDWVSISDTRLPKPVIIAAFKLAVGSYSKPFFVQDSWVIVKSEQKKPATVKKYDDVKDMIKEKLAVQEGTANKDFAKKLEKYTNDAKITINASRYKSVVDNIKKDAAKALKDMSKPEAKPVSVPGK